MNYRQTAPYKNHYGYRQWEIIKWIGYYIRKIARPFWKDLEDDPTA